MIRSSSPIPRLGALRDGLSRVLEQHGIPRDQIGDVRRVEHDHVASYFSEIVECRLARGQTLRLFCKYSGVGPDAGHGQSGHGHWRGVEYEAEVYRQVLQRSPATTPIFYGADRDELTGQTALFIEYLERSWRLNRHPEPIEAMVWAARWLGQFHAANEVLLAEGSWPFLTRYDKDYYLAWARRTAQFAGHQHDRFPWLAPLCAGFEDAIELLLTSPPAVIHAEYYPLNILCREGSVYPIDWESAAVAAGEIDFAALTENWPDEVVRRSRNEYLMARWPGGPPPGFDRTVAAAQVFLHLRWLGDLPGCDLREDRFWRFEALRRVGEQLGVI
jgi:hypothetical protein